MHPGLIFDPIFHPVLDPCLNTPEYSSVCYFSEFPWQMILKLISDVQGLDSAANFGKQNCNISLSQKPVIWFPELLFKFISDFDTVLRLSELTVNLK